MENSAFIDFFPLNLVLYILSPPLHTHTHAHTQTHTHAHKGTHIYMMKMIVLAMFVQPNKNIAY